MTKAGRILSIIGLGLSLGLGLAVSTIEAQQTRTMTFSADDAFLIPGLMVLILPGENNLEVEMVPPKEQLPKEYHDLDLEKGDLILMFNGKRVKTIDDIRDRYDSLAVADSVQFGIKRGQEMRIVSFLKPAEDVQGGGGQVMMVTKEIGDGEADEAGGLKIETMGDGQGPEPVVALDAGVVFSEDEDGLTVSVSIANPEAQITGDPLKEGDRLVSIQDETVTSAKAFRKLYESIPVGAKVKLVFTRDGVEHSASFVKAKPENVMIKKSN